MFGIVILEKVGLRESDFGTYKCVATNAAGRAEATFKLVKGEEQSDLTPRFTSQLKVRTTLTLISN